MPDPTLGARPLHLEPDLEHSLCLEIQDQICRGKFSLDRDKLLILDPHSGDPGKSELVRRLEKYVDFEAGGLRLFSVDVGGRPLTFTAVPGWSSGPEHGAKSLGGPSISLKLTYTW